MTWHLSSSSMALQWVFGWCVLTLASGSYPAPYTQPHHYGKSQPKFMPSEPGKPPSCLKDPRLTYCTDPDDYPKDHILYLLENNMFDVSTLLMDETRDTYTFEGMDAPPMMYSYPAPQPPPYHSYLPPVQPTAGYSNSTPYRPKTSSYYRSPSPSNLAAPPTPHRYRRQAPPGGDDTDLCPSRASYIMPRAAQSVQGDWMFLVNMDDNPRYTQLVRSETCIRNQCTGACQAPPGATATCQQQFVQKRLVALAGTGASLNQDMFWFPSCCVCKIRR